MRVLVTGSRHATPEDGRVVWQMLDVVALARPGQPLVIVHGVCPFGGVDLYADAWAVRHPRATPERHPAERFGPWPQCGPRRNSYMVAIGADLCLGFPGPDSRGTWDCLRKAASAGIPTHVTNINRCATPPPIERRPCAYCGQPVPTDPGPGQHCLVCGKPAKVPAGRRRS